MSSSLATQLANLAPEAKKRIVASLSNAERERLEYEWEFWARPDQVPPKTDWRVWLLLGGRGAGKTRTGCEWVRKQAENNPKARIALVAPTAADVRDVIVEGESGLLAKAPPWFTPKYEPSKRRVTWPNGAIGVTLSADEPERGRGMQWTDFWADECCAWRYPEMWDQIMLGLRLGANPRAVSTTTPKPTKLVRELVKAKTTHVTRSTTYDNRDHLAPAFFAEIIKKYEGTRMGRQELLAEILEDNPSALWKRDQFDKLRVENRPKNLHRIVVGVDPAVSSNEDSDETGIIVAGVDSDGVGYILDDLSGIYTPDQWARQVVRAFAVHNADRIICEVNNGGALVAANVRTVDRNVPIREVRASRGKAVRAEPVAALYEQGRVHHVGNLSTLEDQMVGWNPTIVEEASPDRMDALVWALSDLMVGGAVPSYASWIGVDGPILQRRM